MACVKIFHSEKPLTLQNIYEREHIFLLNKPPKNFENSMFYPKSTLKKKCYKKNYN